MKKEKKEKVTADSNILKFCERKNKSVGVFTDSSCYSSDTQYCIHDSKTSWRFVVLFPVPCQLVFDWYLISFVWSSVPGAFASTWRSGTWSLWRRSHQSYATSSSPLSKRRRRSRGTERWFGPRKCNARQAGPIPKEYGWTNGKKIICIIYIYIYIFIK